MAFLINFKFLKVKVFKLVLFTNYAEKVVTEKYYGYLKVLNRKYGKFMRGKSTERTSTYKNLCIFK